MATTHGPVLGAGGGTSLPARPGTYALLLRLERDSSLAVGRLGRFRFPAGLYVDVGSARGTGGLAARVARHVRCSKPLHWHVDHLQALARPVSVWFVEGDERRECAWAAAVARLPGAILPAPGFGASDCRCPAHLVWSPAVPDRAVFAHATGEAVMEKRLDG